MEACHVILHKADSVSWKQMQSHHVASNVCQTHQRLYSGGTGLTASHAGRQGHAHNAPPQHGSIKLSGRDVVRFSKRRVPNSESNPIFWCHVIILTALTCSYKSSCARAPAGPSPSPPPPMVAPVRLR